MWYWCPARFHISLVYCPGREIISISRTFIMANKYPNCSLCPVTRERCVWTMAMSWQRPHHLVVSVGRCIKTLSIHPSIDRVSIVHCRLCHSVVVSPFLPADHVLLHGHGWYYLEIIHANWPLARWCKIINICICLWPCQYRTLSNADGKCVKLQSGLFIAEERKYATQRQRRLGNWLDFIEWNESDHCLCTSGDASVSVMSCNGPSCAAVAAQMGIAKDVEIGQEKSDACDRRSDNSSESH